jgi:hypothetical protein
MGNPAPHVPQAVTAKCATAEQQTIVRCAVDPGCLRPGWRTLAGPASATTQR